jgi:hypothetical protein
VLLKTKKAAPSKREHCLLTDIVNEQLFFN